MIIVRILGGLGNQMFQYAYAKALEQQGYDVELDISTFEDYKLHGGYQLDKYNIDLKLADKKTTLYSKINIFKTIKEKSLIFNDNLLNLKGNEYVKGYFQTEKYFLQARDTLLKQFTIKDALQVSSKKYKENIINLENSCSLHIRRGDYISDKKANKIHGICDLDYYHRAINLIHKKNKEMTFFIFSDDLLWAKQNLQIENAIYIDHKTIPHEDLYLMSLCKNNITANSSFSWWGAWLNTNKHKTVIAPKKWFVAKENEVACKNWVQL